MFQNLYLCHKSQGETTHKKRKIKTSTWKKNENPEKYGARHLKCLSNNRHRTIYSFCASSGRDARSTRWWGFRFLLRPWSPHRCRVTSRPRSNRFLLQRLSIAVQRCKTACMLETDPGRKKLDDHLYLQFSYELIYLLFLDEFWLEVTSILTIGTYPGFISDDAK